MPDDITYTGSIVREAPEIEAYKLGLIEQANKLYNTPMILPAVEAAGLSQSQIQAADLAKQGIGAYEPYIQGASQGLTQGMDLTSQGARAAGAINVTPQFQSAQNILGQGINVTDQLGGYSELAGAGLQDVGAGTGRVARAGDLAGSYLQGDIRQSLGTLNAAEQAAMAARPSDFGVSAEILGGARQIAGGAAQSYDPGSFYGFMNPYQEAVTQNSLQEMRRQASIAEQGQAAQAIGAGAFGGTREGVQRAEFERGVQDLMGQKIMQDYAQNYGQAQNAAMNAFEAQQGRQLQVGGFEANAANQLANLQQTQVQQALQQSGALQGIGGLYGQQALQQAQIGQSGVGLVGQLGSQQANLGLLPAQIAAQQANIAGQRAGLYGSLGQGIGSLAAQQAGVDLQKASTLGSLGGQMGALSGQMGALGQATQQLGASDVSMLSDLGAIEQQNAQAQLDAMRATEMQETMAPYQQLGFVSDIFRGAPTTQMALTSETSPSAGPLQTAVGLGVGAVSTAAGAAKAGLF